MKKENDFEFIKLGNEYKRWHEMRWVDSVLWITIDSIQDQEIPYNVTVFNRVGKVYCYQRYGCYVAVCVTFNDKNPKLKKTSSVKFHCLEK